MPTHSLTNLLTNQTNPINTMPHQYAKQGLAALVAVGVMSLANISALAAELAGAVQGAKQPIAGSTVTLYAAGTDAPKQLAQGKSDESGAFNLTYPDAPADSILYLIAKGGTPKAGKEPNDFIGLLAVLGGTPPKKVTVNEFTTIASVFTANQFLKGEVLSGKPLGLRIAAGNVKNFVDLETGGYGVTIQDALNSGQTPTMANFATLANVLAGCITRAIPEANSRLALAATPPAGAMPMDTLAAVESLARFPWYQPERTFALLGEFYPVPTGKVLRATPFLPYLSFAPSAWVFPLKFTGGGLSAPGKLMIDSQGNAWAADNFIVGAQNRSRLWTGNLSKFAPDGRPLSPMTTGFTGGGILGPGFGLAIDARDNAWVTSFTGNSINLFDNTGKALSPEDGYTLGGKLGHMQGIIATPNGDIWALDTTGGHVVFIPKGDVTKAQLFAGNPDGNPLKNPMKLLGPFALAIDQQDRIWVANALGEHVTRFSASDPSKVETFPTGVSGSGLAIDSMGNVWVANRFGSSEWGKLKLVEMMAAYKVNFDGDTDGADRATKVMIPYMAGLKSGWDGGSVSVLKPDGSQQSFSPIYGQGLIGPWAAAVDGDDHVWISNFNTSAAGIVQLCGLRPETAPPGKKPGDAISPPGGYVGGGLQMQVDIDIGPAGDVWVTNNWQDYQAALGNVPEALSTLGGGQGLVVFFGMAKPVKTPLIGPVHQP